MVVVVMPREGVYYMYTTGLSDCVADAAGAEPVWCQPAG